MAARVTKRFCTNQMHRGYKNEQEADVCRKLGHDVEVSDQPPDSEFEEIEKDAIERGELDL